MSSRIVVDRPIADVWRFLIDFPRVATWEQGVLAARQTSPGAPGVGTTLDVRRVYFGRATLVKCLITDWDELRGVTMALQGGPLRRATIRYAVEPIGGDRTEVIYTGEGELRGALRVLTPLAPSMGRATERKNLATRKWLLETAGGATEEAARERQA